MLFETLESPLNRNLLEPLEPLSRPPGTARPALQVVRAAEQGPAPGPGHEAATVDLLGRLGQALHRYGAPAHRIEEALAAVSRRLGVEAHFFSTPTAIFLAEGVGREQRTTLYRVEPGEIHLEKLSALDGVLGALAAGRISAAEAARAVEAIEGAAPRYGEIATTLAFACTSAAAARFFGGGVGEILAATFAGLGTGLFAVVAGRVPAVNRLFEPAAAALVSLVATLLAGATGELSWFIVTLAGLIALLPGLSLTVAMTELATRHLVSGSARLAGSALVFLTLGFGVAAGSSVGSWATGLELTGPALHPASVPLPAWTEPLALVLAAVGFLVLFRARPRDLGWILAAGALAFYGGRWATTLAGVHLGALLGALLVGLASHLFARLKGRPAALVQVPGLMLLVPGSLGFRGISSLLAQETLTGIDAAVSMAVVAIALVTGLLLAGVILPPRRSL